MERDAAARARWAAIQEALSEGKPGPLGHVAARAGAQVLPLSSPSMPCLISPLSSRCRIWTRALALWKLLLKRQRGTFCSDALGDALADEIL